MFQSFLRTAGGAHLWLSGLWIANCLPSLVHIIQDIQDSSLSAVAELFTKVSFTYARFRGTVQQALQHVEAWTQTPSQCSFSSIFPAPIHVFRTWPSQQSTSPTALQEETNWTVSRVESSLCLLSNSGERVEGWTMQEMRCRLPEKWLGPSLIFFWKKQFYYFNSELCLEM